MPKHDGTNCQKLLQHSVTYLGVSARLERVADAKAVATTRIGKSPADYFFSYKQYGAYLEAKETLENRFNFGGIKPHQLALAKRCTEGGIHYIFAILRLQTAELFILHSAYMLWHMDKIRRSYITWDELLPFKVMRLPNNFDMRPLAALVARPVPDFSGEGWTVAEFLSEYR